MASIKALINKAKQAHKEWEEGAENRAIKKLDRAKTKSQRDIERHNLKLEKLARKKALQDSITALKMAELKRKEAEQKIKKLGGGGSSTFSKLLGSATATTKKRKRRK